MNVIARYSEVNCLFAFHYLSLQSGVPLSMRHGSMDSAGGDKFPTSSEMSEVARINFVK